MLDIAENNLKGQIPKYINNLIAMLITNISLESYIWALGDYIEYSIIDVLLSLKGKLDDYTFPGIIMSIDLSENNLSGEMPCQITSLAGLQFLNLSNNLLHEFWAVVGPLLYKTSLCCFKRCTTRKEKDIDSKQSAIKTKAKGSKHTHKKTKKWLHGTEFVQASIVVAWAYDTSVGGRG
ncbi:hypothetical protein K1719_020696 [Acacia pycnantha]|nr:hypothetical protein K1719_020696 [Acacia pycnantha]